MELSEGEIGETRPLAELVGGVGGEGVTNFVI